MIVDCGGGTIDITVHELDSVGHIKELLRASGGPHGSIGRNFSFQVYKRHFVLMNLWVESYVFTYV